MKPESLECNRHNFKIWLTKKEYDELKAHGHIYLKTFNNALNTQQFNQAVYHIYTYFETRLPGFFNHFYNMATACDVIDLTKEKINQDLYQRYVNAAKMSINNKKTKRKGITYKDLFSANDPQLIILQNHFFWYRCYDWFKRRINLLMNWSRYFIAIKKIYQLYFRRNW